MAISLTKHQKYGAVFLAGVVLLAGFSLSGEDEQLELQPAVAAHTGKTDEHAVRQTRRDEAAAWDEVPLSELRNPFSFRHEQRGEESSGQDEKNASLPDRKTGVTKTRGTGASGSPEDRQGSAAKPAQQAEKRPAAIALRGIFYGDPGRFAILSAGERSASLTEGESLAGWRVMKIEQDGVLLQGPQGEQYLRVIHTNHHSD